MKDVAIEIPSGIIRSAQYCLSKDETRINISGVYLGINGEVVSTNGHLLYEAKCDFEIESPVLVKPETLLPKSAKHCTIRFLDDKLGCIEYITGSKFRMTTKHIMFVYAKDPDFVDYNAAVKETGKHLREGIILNTKYLSLISSVFPEGHNGCYVEFNHHDFLTVKPCVVRDVRDEKLIIMTMRDENGKFKVMESENPK